MKRIILALLFVAAAAFGQTEIKQQVLVRVGYIDISKILSKYILAQRYHELYEKLKDEEMQALAPLEESLENALYELKLKEPSLDTDEMKGYWAKVVKIRRNIDIKKREIEIVLKRKENKLNEEILKNIHNAINEISLKKGFNLILEKKQVFFAAPEVDLSDLIIEKLNSDYLNTPRAEETEGQ